MNRDIECMIRLREIFAINLAFGIGYGITLHSVVSELWRKGGITEVLTSQGEYWGLAIMFITWVLVNAELICNAQVNKYESC